MKKEILSLIEALEKADPFDEILKSVSEAKNELVIADNVLGGSDESGSKEINRYDSIILASGNFKLESQVTFVVEAGKGPTMLERAQSLTKSVEVNKPEPAKLVQIEIQSNEELTVYRLDQIKRGKELDEQAQQSFIGTFLKSYVGLVLLGPAGLLAGALSKKKVKSSVIGLEFTDSKKIIIILEKHKEAYEILLRSLNEKGLFEIDF